MEALNERRSLLSKQPQISSERSQDFRLEPVLAIVYFGWHLATLMIPNQLLKQTCLIKGYNFSDCSHLSNDSKITKEIEEDIQPEVAKVLMVSSLLITIVPGALSLLLGPWTDKFGRKKVICLGFIAHSIALVLLSLVSYICDKNSKISPWAYVIPYLPVAFSGGWPTMIVSSLCYVTDITDDSSRSLRLTVIEMITFLGILLGNTACSFALKLTTPTNIFLIATIFVVLASTYSVLFIKESLTYIHKASIGEQLGAIFSPRPIVEMLKTCFKPRELGGRKILWCLIMILTLNAFSTHSIHNLFYLFVREKFQWNLQDATLFNALSTLVSITGSFSAVIVMKKRLNISDTVLAAIAILSGIIDALLKATAQSPFALYFALAVCWLKTLIVPMCRSIIASVIHKNEIGKVYSFISSFESVTNLLASPLYTFVYAATFTKLAGAFFFVTAAALTINLVLLINIVKLKNVY